jgi:hypothetical protein
LARHDGSIRATSDEPLSLGELLALLSDNGEVDDRARQDAIACYLSGSEGWHQAGRELGGAFAEAVQELRARKAD